MADLEDRVLSIQSHVVSGYAGNKSACFPLQLLGFEVDAINSVQFSNHTGYPGGFRGQILDETQLADLFAGLVDNDIYRYSHVITGYIGSASFLKKTAEVVKTLKKKNPNLVYVCDPVMGDTEPGLYVPKDLIPIYKDEILPLADVCVPNQFEAEILTGVKIGNQSEAFRAIDVLRSKGIKTVILSSMVEEDGNLVALAVSGSGKKFSIRIPKLPAAFVGTGDLFTALITAWLTRTRGDVKTTLEKVIATMQAVLKRTLDHAKDQRTPQKMELKLIQSKCDICNPKICISALPV